VQSLQLNYYEDYDLEHSYAAGRADSPLLSATAVQGIAYCTAVFDAASRYSGAIGRGAWRGTRDEALLRLRTAVLLCDYWAALRLTNSLTPEPDDVLYRYRQHLPDVVFEEPAAVQSVFYNRKLNAVPGPQNVAADDLTFPQIVQSSGLLESKYTPVMQRSLVWMADELSLRVIDNQLSLENWLLPALVVAATGFQAMHGPGRHSIRGGRPPKEVTFKNKGAAHKLSKKKIAEQKAYTLMYKAQIRYVVGFSLFLTGVTEIARAVEARLSDADRDATTEAVQAAVNLYQKETEE
jgi:hypothetical protein